MKKYIQQIVLICTILCMISYNAEALSKFSNSNELQIYMRQNFRYTLDNVVEPYFDYFESPEILEFSRMGDCDDFATYSWYHLNEMDIKAQRYVLWGKTYEGEDYGHAITVFLDKDDNTYSIFTNQYVLKTSEKNPIDAIKDIYVNWEIICMWNPTKYGLITYEEFKKTVTLCAIKDTKSKLKFIYMMNKLGGKE